MGDHVLRLAWSAGQPWHGGQLPGVWIFTDPSLAGLSRIRPYTPPPPGSVIRAAHPPRARGGPSRGGFAARLTAISWSAAPRLPTAFFGLRLSGGQKATPRTFQRGQAGNWAIPPAAGLLPTSRLDVPSPLRMVESFVATLSPAARPGCRSFYLHRHPCSVEAAWKLAQGADLLITSPPLPTRRRKWPFSRPSTPPARWPPKTRSGRSESKLRVTHLSPRYVAGNAFTPEGPARRSPRHLCQHFGGPRDFLQCGREPRLASGTPPPGRRA